MTKEREMQPTSNMKSKSITPGPTCSLSDSSIDEARNLVQCCAEPRPVGDSVNAAIKRSAKRLGFSYSRTKGIWYGDARRIDSREMDRLRRCAGFAAQFDQAVTGLRVLRNRLSAVSSPVGREIVCDIDA